jgi:hypothetical protein
LRRRREVMERKKEDVEKKIRIKIRNKDIGNTQEEKNKVVIEKRKEESEVV